MVMRCFLCKRCGAFVETKASHQFYCKACSKIAEREHECNWRKERNYDKIRRSRSDVKLKLREYVRRPGVKLRQRKTTRKWRENNLEYSRELGRRYYRQNNLWARLKERIKLDPVLVERLKKVQEKYRMTHRKEISARYVLKYKNDPEFRKKVNFYGSQRRMRKSYAREDFTFNEWWNKVLNSNGICSFCKKNIGIGGITMDHTPSLFKAYLNYLKTGNMTIYTINDVDTLCRSCNSKKGAK